MGTLRSRLIRLAWLNPEVRPHVLPLLEDSKQEESRTRGPRRAFLTMVPEETEELDTLYRESGKLAQSLVRAVGRIFPDWTTDRAITFNVQKSRSHVLFNLSGAGSIGEWLLVIGLYSSDVGTWVAEMRLLQDGRMQWQDIVSFAGMWGLPNVLPKVLKRNMRRVNRHA